MNIFKRSVPYLSKYKWYVIGSFLMMIVVNAASLAVPLLIQRIIDDGVVPKDLNVIKGVAIILVAITIAKAFSSFFQTFWSKSASQGIAYDIRNDLFKKLEYLEFSFHDKHQIGQLLTRITSDVEGIRNFFATGVLQIASAVLLLVGSIVILVITEWKLFLVVSTVLPMIILVFFRMFSILRPIFGSIQKNLGILNNILQENILGIRIVKAYTAEPLELKRYESQNRVIYNENLKKVKAFANGFPPVFFFSNFATVLILYFGGRNVISDELSIGTLIAFNSYLTFLIQPILQLGFVLQQLASATASGTRVFQIIDTKEAISSPSNAIDFEDKAADIEFKNVNFSYVNSEEELTLKNINLHIRKGNNVAILGKTGSGKSTLASLIPRFYDPLSGSVHIAGKDVRQYELTSLRKSIGVVLQEIRLINGSIRENISYGCPKATDEELKRVGKIAQVDTFLSDIPEGLDFNVGEGGKLLSGGQRQRIAIARMLLVEPKLMILDDATSALDSQTEYELIHDAAPYLQSPDHTVVVITHKIDTVKDIDHIVLMDQGQIVAQGNHLQLLETSAEYASLFEEQTVTNE